jgi:hypothetical protein
MVGTCFDASSTHGIFGKNTKNSIFDGISKCFKLIVFGQTLVQFVALVVTDGIPKFWLKALKSHSF